MPDVLVAIDKESPAASGGNAAGASMAALLSPTASNMQLNFFEVIEVRCSRGIGQVRRRDTP
jgi:hypothetical protein